MVRSAVDKFGRLDSAANCAGIPNLWKPLHELELAEWQRTIDVNLTGIFLCLKYQAAAMLKSGGGSIVNIASTIVHRTFPGTAEYTASKAGVVGLTRVAAQDYGRYGIRVNAILPGSVRTPMYDRTLMDAPELEEAVASQHPIGRIGTPSELGDAVRWVLSGEASFITGASICVDGGLTT